MLVRYNHGPFGRRNFQISNGCLAHNGRHLMSSTGLACVVLRPSVRKYEIPLCTLKTREQDRVVSKDLFIYWSLIENMHSCPVPKRQAALRTPCCLINIAKLVVAPHLTMTNGLFYTLQRERERDIGGSTCLLRRAGPALKLDPPVPDLSCFFNLNYAKQGPKWLFVVD